MRGKLEKDLQEATAEYNSLRSSKAATEREKKMRDMAALLKKEVPGEEGARGFVKIRFPSSSSSSSSEDRRRSRRC